MWPLALHRHNVLPSNHQKKQAQQRSNAPGPMLHLPPWDSAKLWTELHWKFVKLYLNVYCVMCVPNSMACCWCECQTVWLHFLWVCQTLWLAIWCVCQTLWLAVSCVCQTLLINLVWVCQTIWRPYSISFATSFNSAKFYGFNYSYAATFQVLKLKKNISTLLEDIFKQ